MSFRLEELLDYETKTDGWFLLLDEAQGLKYNFPCRFSLYQSDRDSKPLFTREPAPVQRILLPMTPVVFDLAYYHQCLPSLATIRDCAFRE